MNCPQCGKATDVIDSRARGATVKRRRRCPNDHRFTTTEIIGEPKAIVAAIAMLRKAFP